MTNMMLATCLLLSAPAKAQVSLADSFSEARAAAGAGRADLDRQSLNQLLTAAVISGDLPEVKSSVARGADLFFLQLHDL